MCMRMYVCMYIYTYTECLLILPVCMLTLFVSSAGGRGGGGVMGCYVYCMGPYALTPVYTSTHLWHILFMHVAEAMNIVTYYLLYCRYILITIVCRAVHIYYSL